MHSCNNDLGLTDFELDLVLLGGVVVVQRPHLHPRLPVVHQGVARTGCTAPAAHAATPAAVAAVVPLLLLLVERVRLLGPAAIAEIGKNL